MKKLLLYTLLLFAQIVISAPGDTITVTSLSNAQLTWWGEVIGWGEFPDTTKSYRKILMDVELGCADGGCSDWDYTVQINGYYKLNPDDTLPKKYELGRFMTPYGGYMADGLNGFDNDFKHTFTYDVTDLSLMFHDSVKISAFYGGWSSGFSANVTFRMIEGTPVREVLKMHSIYQSGPGGWRSDNKDTFEIKYAPSKNIMIDSNTTGVMARIIPSGHGFVNSQNCAEFCERDYYILTDGTNRYTQSMWRDDCGMNAIYPQGGTWLYDRANWCPGDITFAYNHELTDFITAGSNLNIDLDVEINNLTVPAGETPPNYIIEGQLFEYSAINTQNDVEISDIISPSLTDEHSRKNPICGKPVIKIKNNGVNDLTSLTISYGVKGASTQTFNWTGSLKFNESEIIELDVLNNWNGSSNIFEVSLSQPNGTSDEYDLDNNLSTPFENVDAFPNDIVIGVYTNSRPYDNEWILFNSQGNDVGYRDLTQSYTDHYDTMNLANGCYEFLLTDAQENGLYWWANNYGYGEAKFRSGSTDSTYKMFQSDFGTEIRYQFLIDNTLSVSKNIKSTSTKIIPNPNNGNFIIESDLLKYNFSSINIFDALGNLVYSIKNETRLNKVNLNLEKLSKGIYMVNISSEKGSSNQKVSIID